jgi:hypothetical protein
MIPLLTGGSSETIRKELNKSAPLGRYFIYLVLEGDRALIIDADGTLEVKVT